MPATRLVSMQLNTQQDQLMVTSSFLNCTLLGDDVDIVSQPDNSMTFDMIGPHWLVLLR